MSIYKKNTINTSINTKTISNIGINIRIIISLFIFIFIYNINTTIGIEIFAIFPISKFAYTISCF